MNLARLFMPGILSTEDGWTTVMVFAIGPADADRIQNVKGWAITEALKVIDEYSTEDEFYELGDIAVETGPFSNDRSQAEAESCSWCVSPTNDIWPDWQDDEPNIEELRVVAPRSDKGECVVCGARPDEECDTTHPDGRCRDLDLVDDWQERVNADPDRWPCAPLGPFPGVIVTIKIVRDPVPAGAAQ